MKYFLIALVCVSFVNCNGQMKKSTHQFFSKQNLDCDFKNNKVQKYYKLVLAKEGNPFLQCKYYFDFSHFTESEKVQMIEDLLTFEGDSSSCSTSPKCYSAIRSQTVPRQVTVYSIQVEALFIINHIFLSDPYSFSAFPILRNKKGNIIEAMAGPLIKQAYTSYREWLREVRKGGLTTVVAKGILPLGENSEVLWF